MTSTGYNVMGWGVDDETGDIKQDTVTALRIMSAANLTYPPEATSKAYVSGILDKNDTDVTSSNGKAVNLNFYDNLGYSYTARLVFKQSSNTDEYSVEMTKLLDSEGNELDISGVKFGTTDLAQSNENTMKLISGYTWDKGTLKKGTTEVVDVSKSASWWSNDVITDDGQKALDALAEAYGYEGSTDDFLNQYITSANDGTIGDMLKAGKFDPTSTDVMDADGTINTKGRVFDGALLTFDGDTGKFDNVNSSTSVTLSGLGTNFSDISIDFSECSMYDNKGTSTIGATSGDLDGLGTGRRLGDMIGVSIQNNGMIYASYDNGMTRLLGQIATANFANASGLEKEGDNLYSSTLNSGEFDGIGVDVTANGGYMSTGQLEMSNVDLSTEFTEMITTQRGFQANSRIITVSDTLLEELTNLKR
jgi:flagellar hook protein FlgE